MAQLSTKIKEYAKAQSVANVDFLKDVMLQDDGQGAYIKEWNLAIAKPSDEQLNAYEASANDAEYNAGQIAKRVAEYGSSSDQLAYIMENGVDAFVAKQQAIKDKYPKK
jgi:hypothetical protein